MPTASCEPSWLKAHERSCWSRVVRLTMDMFWAFHSLEHWRKEAVHIELWSPFIFTCFSPKVTASLKLGLNSELSTACQAFFGGWRRGEQCSSTHLIVWSSLAVAKIGFLGCTASPHSSPSACPWIRQRGLSLLLTDTSNTSPSCVPTKRRSPLQHTLRTLRPETGWQTDSSC